jgi:Domain of unknown function (DUF4437)
MSGSSHVLCVVALGLLVAADAGAQKITGESRDRGKEFVGWVQPERLYWRPFVVAGLPDAEFKLLSFDETTKARSQITRLPAGWKQPQGYHNTNEEIFVLSGDLTVGDKKMTKYSYAYYPAGHVHGPSHTEYGATLLHWWDGTPDFVVGSETKPGTRVDELVEDWNYYDKPWTRNEDFPKWAAFPPPRDTRLKLLRKDKVTGQMTWMNMGAGGGSSVRTGAPGRGRWEAHPSFEEAMLLEGELTYGECLPGVGEMVGTYTSNGYFFRPADIRHGGPSAYSPSYFLFIFRSGKSIWADYFENCNEPRK